MIEEEKKLPARDLILIGLPLFVLAVTVSMVSHQYVHIIASKAVCGEGNSHSPSIVSIIDLHRDQSICAAASFAGVCWTLFLAVASFALFTRRPGNMFLASMAFVNASTRIPESVTVFLQLLFHGKAKLAVDESASLSLLHFQDPSVSVILLFFLSLVTMCLTVTVIHDTKVVPWKWFVALLLFASIIPIENLEWKLLSPLLP